MKTVLVTLAVLALCAGSLAAKLPKAKCTAACVLPDCFCSGITPPIMPDDPDWIPQIVYLTFDDAISTSNYPLYQKIFEGRKNPNGAKITGTFFVTHEYNNYSMTHQLWREGHEIALHSITHKSDQNYWKTLDKQGWIDEVIAQRTQIATFANIPEDDIQGFRAPFLQGNADEMYSALYENGVKYESSRPSWRIRPNLWPYTMDYDTVQDCQILPCPEGIYPGFWVSPLVDLLGSNDQPCAFVDTCLDAPKTKAEAYNLLLKNFNDHYNNYRAPYGLYTHASWLLNEDAPFIQEAYIEFIDYILSLQDVYIVSIQKGLEYTRKPVALSGVINDPDLWKDFSPPTRPNCNNPFNCQYPDNLTPPGFGERIMSSCRLCPTSYPWLGNPLGD